MLSTITLNYEDGATNYGIFESLVSKWARNLCKKEDIVNKEHYVLFSRIGKIESYIGFNIMDLIFNLSREVLFDKLFVRLYDHYFMLKIKERGIKHVNYYQFYVTFYDLLIKGMEEENVLHQEN